MNPQRKVELVEREYWTCNHPDHRHKSEAAALSCIQRKPGGPAPKWSFTPSATRQIAIDLISGMPVSAVQGKHGVSEHQAKRALRKTRGEVYAMCRRTMGLNTKDWPSWVRVDHTLSGIRERRHEWLDAINSLD